MADIQTEPQSVNELDLDNIEETENFIEEYLAELPEEIKALLIKIMQIRREIREKARKMDTFLLTPPVSNNPLPEIRNGALNLENRIQTCSRVKQEIILDPEIGIKLITVFVKSRALRDIKRSERITINSSGFSIERTVETDPLFFISKKGPHTILFENQSISEPITEIDINVSPGAKQEIVFNDGLSIESLEGVTLKELLERFRRRLKRLSDIPPLNRR